MGLGIFGMLAVGVVGAVGLAIVIHGAYMYFNPEEYSTKYERKASLRLLQIQNEHDGRLYTTFSVSIGNDNHVLSVLSEEHISPHSQPGELENVSYRPPYTRYLYEYKMANGLVKSTSDFVVPGGATCRQRHIGGIAHDRNPEIVSHCDYRIAEEFVIPCQDTNTMITLVAITVSYNVQFKYCGYGYRNWFISKGLARKGYIDEGQLKNKPVGDLTWRFESNTTPESDLLTSAGGIR